MLVFMLASGPHQQYICSSAFRYPGQLLNIRDCPGDSGTIGAYVRMGETLVYTRETVQFVDQQQIWIPFIKYLKDLICEEMKTALLFRSWDSFGMVM